jgi:hypothetical protein
MKLRIFTFALFALPALSLSASERLAIAVSPHHSFAPASLVVRVHVPPDVSNRMLEVVAESADYYRSSQIQLDGVDTPATRLLEFRDVPGGDYDVQAILTDNTGRQRASAREHVIVLSSDSEW